MTRKHFTVDQQVKLLVDKVPYYCGYAGNPKVTIPAGTVGTVGAVDVPYVVRRNKTFTCVDFDLPGVFNGNPQFNKTIWRCSCDDNEIGVVG